MIARLRNHHPGEEGQALVLVLVISVLLVVSVALVLTTSRASISYSSAYSTSAQALLAARAGLDAEIQAIRNDSAYQGFYPCSLSGSLPVQGAVSTYSVTVSYMAGSSPLSCTGSTLVGTPTAATIDSSGVAPHGSLTVMQAQVALGPAATSALGYAIVADEMTGASSMSVDQYPSGTGPVPNIYITPGAPNQTVTLPCDSSATLQGNVTSYEPTELQSNCTIDGSVQVISTSLPAIAASCSPAGLLSSSSSDIIKGNVTTYGGGIALCSSSTVDGNATANGGGMVLSSATVDGYATANGGGIGLTSSSIDGNATANGGGITLTSSSTIGTAAAPVNVTAIGGGHRTEQHGDHLRQHHIPGWNHCGW